MKNKLFFLASLLAVVFLSCKKDDQTVSFLGAKEPVLTASSTSALVLMNANGANNALSFSWTNPNYKFSTGSSSQDVTYTLQVDTTSPNGNTFSSGIKQESSIAKDLGITYTVKDLNALLTKMNLVENMPHSIEFRVKASLVNGALPLYSNVIKMMITPYLDAVVEPPLSGKLFITGSATPASWMGGGDPELASQRFTKISSTVYEITLSLSAGNSFLFVPAYGNWNDKYGYTGAGNANNVNGDTFKYNGNDIKSPAVSGTYKITVNFKLGTYTVVKQ